MQNDREVLFQKLGNTWYVFTETENDVVYSVLPDGMNPHTTKLELFEVIEDHLERVADHYNKAETAA
ncbi:MAG: hypothetical protein CME70_21210 [Halobacteriovorax sp.]|nr:hypothetical protein [Halobacteriovorax sp.]|tara:strand:+ start:96090 stop:96290 length:201 start_codon:yes stop_codon:yes gene_type:complete